MQVFPGFSSEPSSYVSEYWRTKHMKCECPTTKVFASLEERRKKMSCFSETSPKNGRTTSFLSKAKVNTKLHNKNQTGLKRVRAVVNLSKISIFGVIHSTAVRCRDRYWAILKRLFSVFIFQFTFFNIPFNGVH